MPRIEGNGKMSLRRAKLSTTKSVFLNRRAAAQYRALASIIPGRERPEETTICYKISLVQLITNQVDKQCGRRFKEARCEAMENESIG